MPNHPATTHEAEVSPRLEKLLDRFEHGDKVALARLITLIENHAPERNAVIERVYSKTGHAHIIGITGPPGAGKSTLVNVMIAKYRAMGKQVAVLAIDPSSPFSGGAVLGDRVRMTDHYKDTGVYIRSISSRGSHGGLSRAAREIVKLLDAFGHDIIIIETVGVGQTELGIMDLAQTTVVVTVPEGGDAVQVMKAGLNEIADVFVVNKADRDGADRIKAELELNVHLRPAGGWHPPVLMTQAAADKGVDRVIESIAKHGDYVALNRDSAHEADRRAHELIEVLSGELEDRASRALKDSHQNALLARVRDGQINPYGAVRMILDDPAQLNELLALGKNGNRK